MTRYTGIREALRAVVKESVWLAVRYEPGDLADIALFCSRRGGSTWLMEIVSANRGVLPLNQPIEAFTPNLTPYQFSRLPKFDRGEIIHPDAEEEREFKAYTDELFAGRMRVNAPHAPWQDGFSLRANRLALKIVSAKAMMDWFDANYRLQIVYLVRHPIPQSMSCLRLGWGTSTKAFLRNEWFVEEVIGDPAAAAFAWRTADHGTGLERLVLNWALENLYPLRVLPDRPHWLALSYEEILTDQERVLTDLRQRLALQDVDRMRRAARTASRSSELSTDGTVSAIAEGDRPRLVGGWLGKVEPDQQRATATILDVFGITLYSPDSPMPNWSGCRATP